MSLTPILADILLAFAGGSVLVAAAAARMQKQKVRVRAKRTRR